MSGHKYVEEIDSVVPQKKQKNTNIGNTNIDVQNYIHRICLHH